MKRKNIIKRLIAMLLTSTMITSSVAYADVIAGNSELYNSINSSVNSGGVSQSLLSTFESNGGQNNNSAISNMDDEYEPTDEVTMIIELDEEPLIDINNFSGISFFNNSNNNDVIEKIKQSHDKIKNDIKNLINNNSVTRSNINIEFIYDYNVVMNGLSIKTQYQYLDKIKGLEGVKNAFVAQEYTMELPENTTETNMYSSSEMVGASTAIENGYSGKGTVVAILDSGLDINHEAFNTYMPENQKYNRDTISEIIGEAQLTAKKTPIEKVYVNDKIPYVYDYADLDTDVDPGNQSSGEHGTHVAGTIAANTDNLTGVAPDAQIMMMKVFSSGDGSTSDAILIAALDDAVKLGADSINMSLGACCGFSEAADKATREVYERVKNAGINLAVSAGNNNNAAIENMSGANLPYATDPDYSIVGSPSTFDASMAVASMINTEMANMPYFTVNGKEIYALDISGENDPKIGSLNGTYPYVYCGYGTVEDFQTAGYVKGKVALVSRGNINFSDKIKNAYDAGATAIIIANNQSGFINMTVDEYLIPTVMITKKDGEYLRDQTKCEAIFSNDYFGSMQNPQGYQMSDFSSWGATPDLKLKPEITAPGENIYSSVLNNKYALMSGTSMASPHIAGLFASVKQYVKEAYPSLSNIEMYNLVNALIMSTATPAKDTNGEYYSPRKQGAGLANVEDAIDGNVYLSVDGCQKPKAELGYNTEGTFSFSVNVHNMSQVDNKYTIDTAALIEAVNDSGLFTMESKIMLVMELLLLTQVQIRMEI